MPRTGSSLVIPFVALTLACRPHDRPREIYAIRDSASVQIVETNIAALDSSYGWELDTANAVRISGPDSLIAMTSWSFDKVTQTSGGYVVSPGRGMVLRVFDSLGHYVRGVGRRGKGPGEFLFIHGISSMPGDSLLVIDDEKMTANVVDVVTGSISERRISFPNSFGSDYVGRFTDGSTAWTTYRTTGGEDVDVVRLFRMKPDVSGPLGTLSSPMFANYTRRVWEANPWSPTSVMAVADSLFYYASNANEDILGFGVDNKVRRIVRLRGTIRAPAAGDLERARAAGARYDSLVGTHFGEYLARVNHLPDRYPAFAWMLRDEKGRVWVQEFTPVRLDPQRWFIVDPDGRVSAIVNIPENLEVASVGSRRIVAIRRTVDGEVIPAIYSIISVKRNRR
jgi:hypothetical protein